jgi:ABC-2 type transport system permease protein
MLAIYKREVVSYFRSFIGFLFIAVTLFFLGVYFTAYNLQGGMPYLSYTVSGVLFVFLISVPLLTMRVLAEERKNKTDQLILTAPVSVGGVVGGKFLALSTIFAIPTGILCLYPIILNAFGTIPLGEAYLSILAFFIYGLTCIAIGLLVSSLTESQVISAVLSFVILFLGYMMNSISGLISYSGNWLTKLLSCFDLVTPFLALLNGTLNLKSLVYFLSLILLALFLTVQSIQKRRYSVSVKSIKLGAYSGGMIAVALVLAVLINMIVDQMPVSWTSLDLTSDRLYSLTNQTKQYVSTLSDDVKIYVLVNQEQEDTMVGQTLKNYEDLSSHITVEYVDPVLNPSFYLQYTDGGSVSSNSLIVVGSKRFKVVDYNDLYAISYSMDDYGQATSNATGYDGEGQITSALDYVTSDNMPIMYTLQGHGEADLTSSFEAAVTKENVDMQSLDLMNEDQVPEDASCLYINGASSDFSAEDADKIIAYLERGGKVILVTYPAALAGVQMTNEDKILSYMGLSLATGLVVEQDADHYFQQIPLYLLPDMEASTYTTGIYGNYHILAPFSQGILIDNEETEDIQYQKILTTSDEAFAKAVIADTSNLQKEEGDGDGPFLIGVAANKTAEEAEGTLVVYSCDQMFTDEANAAVSGANLSLFANTISGFVSHESSVSIPVKDYNVSTILLTQLQSGSIAIVICGILPLGFLIAGFLIWFHRRKK